MSFNEEVVHKTDYGCNNGVLLLNLNQETKNTFLDVLKEKLPGDWGPVDLNWFQNACAHNNAASLEVPPPFLEKLSTPCHTQDCKVPETFKSQSLFSLSSDDANLNVLKSHHSSDTVVQGIDLEPSINYITPVKNSSCYKNSKNWSPGEFVVPSHDVKYSIQRKQSLSKQLSTHDLMEWSPITQQNNPECLKSRFKTPISHSTPHHIAISLGVDPVLSNVSWTSSMATPPLALTIDKYSETIHNVTTEKLTLKPIGAARSLFKDDNINFNKSIEEINYSMDEETNCLENVEELKSYTSGNNKSLEHREKKCVVDCDQTVVAPDICIRINESGQKNVNLVKSYRKPTNIENASPCIDRLSSPEEFNSNSKKIISNSIQDFDAPVCFSFRDKSVKENNETSKTNNLNKTSFSFDCVDIQDNFSQISLSTIETMYRLTEDANILGTEYSSSKNVTSIPKVLCNNNVKYEKENFIETHSDKTQNENNSDSSFKSNNTSLVNDTKTIYNLSPGIDNPETFSAFECGSLFKKKLICRNAQLKENLLTNEKLSMLNSIKTKRPQNFFYPSAQQIRDSSPQVIPIFREIEKSSADNHFSKNTLNDIESIIHTDKTVPVIIKTPFSQQGFSTLKDLNSSRTTKSIAEHHPMHENDEPSQKLSSTTHKFTSTIKQTVQKINNNKISRLSLKTSSENKILKHKEIIEDKKLLENVGTDLIATSESVKHKSTKAQNRKVSESFGKELITYVDFSCQENQFSDLTYNSNANAMNIDEQTGKKTPLLHLQNSSENKISKGEIIEDIFDLHLPSECNVKDLIEMTESVNFRITEGQSLEISDMALKKAKTIDYCRQDNQFHDLTSRFNHFEKIDSKLLTKEMDDLCSKESNSKTRLYDNVDVVCESKFQGAKHLIRPCINDSEDCNRHFINLEETSVHTTNSKLDKNKCNTEKNMIANNTTKNVILCNYDTSKSLEETHLSEISGGKLKELILSNTVKSDNDINHQHLNLLKLIDTNRCKYVQTFQKTDACNTAFNFQSDSQFEDALGNLSVTQHLEFAESTAAFMEMVEANHSPFTSLSPGFSLNYNKKSPLSRENSRESTKEGNETSFSTLLSSSQHSSKYDLHTGNTETEKCATDCKVNVAEVLLKNNFEKHLSSNHGLDKLSYKKNIPKGYHENSKIYINQFEDCNEKIIEAKKIPGFSTASGKKVKISPEALLKAEKIWKENFYEVNDELKNIHTSYKSSEPLKTEVIFSKISQLNKAISEFVISDEAVSENLQEKLEFSKDIYNDTSLHSEINDNQINKIIEYNKPKDINEEPIFNKTNDEHESLPLIFKSGFSTASGKKIEISEMSLNRAQKFIEEIDKNINFSEALQNQIDKSIPDVINKSNSLSSINQSNNAEIIGETICDDYSGHSSQHRLGFETASGRKVSPSEKSLLQGNSTFSRKQPFLDSSTMKSHQNLLKVHSDFEKDLENSHNMEQNDFKFYIGSGNKFEVQNCEIIMDHLSKSLSSALNSEEKPLNNKIDIAHIGEHNSNIIVDIEQQTVNIKLPEEINVLKSNCDSKDLSNKFYQMQPKCQEIQTETTFETKVQNIFEFSTAEKKDEVSTEALKKSTIHLNDFENNRNDLINDSMNNGSDSAINVATISENKAQNIARFRTDAGKKIEVSTESSKESKISFNKLENNDSKNNGFDLMINTFAISKDNVQNILEFSTVSGEKVELSGEELRKSKILSNNLENNDKNYLIGDSKNNKFDLATNIVATSKSEAQTIFGFSTTSGNKVEMSTKALKKSKILFSNFENNDENDTINDLKNNRFDLVTNVGIESGNKTQNSFGFSTASGKKVEVSAEALKKSKILFKNFENNNENGLATNFSINIASECSIVENKAQHILGFTTASGKKKDVSAEALKKSKILFSKFENNDENDINSDLKNNRFDLVTNVGTKSGNKTQNCFGFSTASGKKFEVSAEALKKSKILFKNFENNDENGLVTDLSTNIASEECSTMENKSQNILGFTTASGKKIDVSAEALKKSKILFNDLENYNENDINDLKSNGFDLSHTAENKVQPSLGFSTASGKKVEISAEALKKSKIFFNDLENYDENDINDLKINGFNLSTNMAVTSENKAQNSFGFNTASGKKVEVSAEAMKKSKILFKNFENNGEKGLISNLSANIAAASEECSTILENKAQNILGFNTASGKKVDISAEALKKSKVIFNKFENEDENSIHMSSNTVEEYCSTSKNVQHDERYFQRSDVSKSVKCANFKRRKSNSLLTSDLVTNGKRLSPDSLHSSVSNKKLKIDTTVSLSNSVNNILIKRQANRLVQNQMIIDKKNNTIIPSLGSILTLRKSQTKISLKEFVKRCKRDSYSETELLSFGVRQSTLMVKSHTASNLVFHIKDFFDENIVEVNFLEHATIIPADNGTIGKEEFCKAFMTCPSVDPALVSEDWVYNHYQLIIWKLAALEVAFPQTFGGRSLTPERVMSQLKYRYDREIDSSQRSALKKILEQDDTSAKTMILCIFRILSLPSNISSMEKEEIVDETKMTSLALIELTDGWYKIKTVVDKALTALLLIGHISVGDKLCINGAELSGSLGACSPLEASSNHMFKICINSTRRAKWFCKLGYLPNPQPFPVSLSSLFSDGGSVGCVDVLISRVYPMQFMERLADGGIIFRNVKAEEKAAQLHDLQNQKRIEELFIKIQDEFEKKSSSQSTRRYPKRVNLRLINNIQNGEELYEIIQSAPDPYSIEASLNPSQHQLLTDYQCRLRTQKQEDLQAEFRRQLEERNSDVPQRNVVPLLKIRVQGLSHIDQDKQAYTILTVWRPNDNIIDLLQEKACIRIFHLSVSTARSKCSYNANVQLNTNNHTRYEALSVEKELVDDIFPPKQVFSIPKFQQPDFTTLFEVDLVGIVIIAESLSTQLGNYGPSVFLADADMNFIRLRFRGSMKVLGCDDILSHGSFVSASNLSWQSGMCRSPMLFASELTLFTHNPKEEYLKIALQSLMSNIQDVDKFIALASKKLFNIDQRSSSGRHSLETVQNFKSSDATKFLRPVVSSYQFELPQAETSKNNKSDSKLSASFQEIVTSSHILSKLAKLERYASPPSLIPLSTPPCLSARSRYKSPFLAKPPKNTNKNSNGSE